jgi:hypothetical protein
MYRQDGRCLLGAAFAAVADLADLQASRGRKSRHSLDLLSPQFGDRSLWVLGFALGLAVLNQIEFHQFPPSSSNALNCSSMRRISISSASIWVSNHE